MTYSFPKNSKAATDAKRPKGYFEAMVEGAKDDGDFYLVSEEHRQAVFKRFFGPEPSYASIPTKAGRLVAAIAFWGSRGFPIRERSERERIQEICESCPFWLPDGNAGLGECGAGCNCSRFAWWVETKHCIKGFW